MFSLKNDRNHRLETGWNDRLIEHRENKYIKSVDRAEMLQLMRNTSPSPTTAGSAVPQPLQGNDSVFSAKPATAASRQKNSIRGEGGGGPATDRIAGGTGAPGSTTSSMYESITKAVGFKHHRGTDRNAELKVLKVILQRENKLIELQTECNKINREAPALRNSDRTGILDLLSQIRDLCVTLLENVVSWRETMVNADPEAPRPFMWQKQNYIMKMVDDLNFLSYVDPLVSALKIDSEKMVKNPLMLPETLGSVSRNTNDEAFTLAQEDAQGNTKGPVFLERLRLRIAEQVFLKEIDFNKFGMPSIAWTEYNPSVISTDGSSVGGGGSGSVHLNVGGGGNRQHYNDERKLALLDWQEQANRQLKRIMSSQGEQLRSASTQRLLIPSALDDPEEFTGVPKFSFYPTPGVVPSLLTDLHLGDDEELEDTRSPIYLRGHFREPSPMMHEEAKREKSRAAAAIARNGSKAGQRGNAAKQSPTSPGYDSGEDSFGAFDKQQGQQQPKRKGKGVREIRGLPESSSSTAAAASRGKLYVGPVSSSIAIAPILGLEQPPTTVLRAAGAVRILIADNDTIPEDLSWARFLEVAGQCDVAEAMSTLDVNGVPRFKLRAVTPFLDQLMTPGDLDDMTEEVKLAVESITAWIQHVLDAAENPAAYIAPSTATNTPNGPPSSVSPTGSAFDGSNVAAPRERNGKRASRPKKVSRDTTGGGPTELRLLAYRPPKPHDTNLAIVYSEMVTHLFIRPVVLSLLVPSPDKSGDSIALPPTSKESPDAFKKGLAKQVAKYVVAKVYDAATSHTSETILNLREYIRYQEDLVQQHNDESVRELFQPELVGWWIENLKNVSTVSLKPGGDLVLRVSKSMIGRRVARFLGVYMSRDSGDFAATDTNESLDVSTEGDSVADGSGGDDPGKTVVKGSKGSDGKGSKGAVKSVPNRDLYGTESTAAPKGGRKKQLFDKAKEADKKEKDHSPATANDANAALPVSAQVRTAPQGKKSRGSAAARAATTNATSKPTASTKKNNAADRQQQHGLVKKSSGDECGQGRSGPASQYGSTFAPVPVSKGSDNAEIDPGTDDDPTATAASKGGSSKGNSSRSSKNTTGPPHHVIDQDPYAEPVGGFKIAKSENKSTVSVRTDPLIPPPSDNIPVAAATTAPIKPKSNETAKKSADESQQEQSVMEPALESATETIPVASAASMNDSILGGTGGQSAVYDDEFEEEEEMVVPVVQPAPAAQPALSPSAEEEQQRAPLAQLPVHQQADSVAVGEEEGEASYADDFDDTGGYGDEFEEEDTGSNSHNTANNNININNSDVIENNSSKSGITSSTPTTDPAHIPVRATASPRQESEETVAPVVVTPAAAPALDMSGGGGDSYADDFDDDDVVVEAEVAVEAPVEIEAAGVEAQAPVDTPGVETPVDAPIEGVADETGVEVQAQVEGAADVSNTIINSSPALAEEDSKGSNFGGDDDAGGDQLGVYSGQKVASSSKQQPQEASGEAVPMVRPQASSFDIEVLDDENSNGGGVIVGGTSVITKPDIKQAIVNAAASITDNDADGDQEYADDEYEDMEFED